MSEGELVRDRREEAPGPAIAPVSPVRPCVTGPWARMGQASIQMEPPQPASSPDPSSCLISPTRHSHIINRTSIYYRCSPSPRCSGIPSIRLPSPRSLSAVTPHLGLRRWPCSRPSFLLTPSAPLHSGFSANHPTCPHRSPSSHIPAIFY